MTSAARRVEARGDGLAIDVRQAAGATRASGRFRAALPGGVTVEMTQFGVLQTAKDWASVTGWARIVPEGGEEAVTAIVDRAAAPGVLVVHVAGREPIVLPLAR
jgi:hypothetical protein